MTLASPARAAVTPQAIGARISARGIDFINGQAARLIPNDLPLPNLSQVLYDCPLTSNDPTLTTSNGDMQLHLNQVQLVPQSGSLEATIGLDAVVNTDVHLSKPYACFGSADCHVTGNVRNLVISAVFAPRNMGGQVAVDVVSVDFQLAPQDLDVDSSGCLLGDFATLAIDVLKGFILDHARPLIDSIARSQLQSMLASTLAGMTAQSGNIAGFDYTAQLSKLTVEPSGLTALVDTGVVWSGPQPACIPQTPPPAAGGAATPDFGSRNDHLGLAVARPLLSGVLDAAWRSGMMCLSSKNLPANMQALLPMMPVMLGMPVGTTMDFELHSSAPPAMTIADAGGTPTATLTLDGLSLVLSASYPDGSSGRLDIEADLGITATLDVDPVTNTFVLGIVDAQVRRLDLLGSQGPILKMDPVRVEQFVRDVMLPVMADRVGALPLSAAVLHTDASPILSQAYVLVNDFGADDHFAYVFADLFVRPESDNRAPSTRFASTPPALTHPGVTRFVFDGSDDQTPPRLLRYRVRIDGGAWSTPSFAHAVSAPATDGVHTIEAAAVDLNGNVDPNAIRQQFEVDAMPPTIAIVQAPQELEHTRNLHVQFQGSDDRTSPQDLRYRWRLRQVDASGGATKTVSSQDFVAGIDQFDFQTPGNGMFELEVAVQDAAGNMTSAPVRFAVAEDGGCQVAPLGGASTGAAHLLPLAALALLGLARRRRSRSAR